MMGEDGLYLDIWENRLTHNSLCVNHVFMRNNRDSIRGGLYAPAWWENYNHQMGHGFADNAYPARNQWKNYPRIAPTRVACDLELLVHDAHVKLTTRCRCGSCRRKCTCGICTSEQYFFERLKVPNHHHHCSEYARCCCSRCIKYCTCCICSKKSTTLI